MVPKQIIEQHFASLTTHRYKTKNSVFGDIYATCVSPPSMWWLYKMAPIWLLITNSAAIRFRASFIAGRRFPSAASLRNLTAHCLFSGTVFVHVHNSSKGTAYISASVFFVVAAKAPVYGFYANNDVVIDKELLWLWIKTFNNVV